MTYPPQGSDERGERRRRAGASRIDPDRFPTERRRRCRPRAAPGRTPDEAVLAEPAYGAGAGYPSPQYRPPTYGQTPPFGPSQPYGSARPATVRPWPPATARPSSTAPVRRAAVPTRPAVRRGAPRRAGHRNPGWA